MCVVTTSNEDIEIRLPSGVDNFVRDIILYSIRSESFRSMENIQETLEIIRNLIQCQVLIIVR